MDRSNQQSVCNRGGVFIIAALIVVLFTASSSLAGKVRFTSIGCDTIESMHQLTRLAGSGDFKALAEVEREFLRQGQCLRIEKGGWVELISSVRTRVPGTRIHYSLAQVFVEGRRVFVNRRNLAP